ncbi:MAG: hypothetical protein IPK97_06155 [Ahniella sp.]|nr:hypothetical protein [Ahniella sp.]
MIRTITFLAALGLASASNAAPVVLSPGVLVDVEGDRAFAVDPSGFTQYIELGNGAARWVSPETAYPLVLADGFLVALAAPDWPGSAVVLLLNPSSGEIIDRVSFDLPETVAANFFPKPKRKFEASAVDTPEGVRIFWRHEFRELRGAVIVETDQNGDEVINPITIETGAFDLVRDQNRHYAVPVRTAFSQPPALTVALNDNERLADISGTQLRAADNRHVQTFQALPHDTFGQIYQWSVFDRTGERKGGYTSPYSRAPFVVDDGTLVIRDQPFGYAEANGSWTERGTRLVGINLASGTERWSFPVLDQEYRGPLPP